MTGHNWWDDEEYQRRLRESVWFDIVLKGLVSLSIIVFILGVIIGLKLGLEAAF